MSTGSTTILVVEDAPEDRELVRRALGECRLGLKLYMVKDGVEALEFLQRQGSFSNPQNAPRPRLILVDLNMPRMDGHQFLAQLRADPSLQAISVVVFTTSSYEPDIVRAYQAGCNSFVTKPVDADEFVDTLRRVGKYWIETVSSEGN